MPLAGQRILAADFPTSVVVQDSTTQSALTTTAVVGSPEINATFVAPTSGVVQVTLSMRAYDPSAATSAVLDFKLYEDDVNGALVYDLGNILRQLRIVGNSSTISQVLSRVCMLTELTPGQQYYLVLYQNSTTGTTPIVTHREVSVIGLAS